MKLVRAITLVALAAAFCGVSNAAPPSTHGKTKTSAWMQTGPGRASRVFTMRQPRGIVLLTRLTTTYGIRASVAARIPSGAGVGVVNFGTPRSPAPCRRRGSLLICTQSQEGCPMPEALWRVHLLKTGGPAGVVRFDFVVG